MGSSWVAEATRTLHQHVQGPSLQILSSRAAAAIVAPVIGVVSLLAADQMSAAQSPSAQLNHHSEQHHREVSEVDKKTAMSQRTL